MIEGAFGIIRTTPAVPRPAVSVLSGILGASETTMASASRDGRSAAIIDANTAQWILKVGIGDVIDVNDGNGKPVKLRVVALLHESIFQSEVLIAEEHFLTLFPRQEGFTFFLIDVESMVVEVTDFRIF